MSTNKTQLQTNNTLLNTIKTKIKDIKDIIQGKDPFEPENIEHFTYTVQPITNATYGFSLNSSGYYESQNKGKANTYAICRVNFTVNTQTNIVFDCINFAESVCDYGLIGNLDTALSLSTTADSSTNLKQNFNGKQSASVVTITFENVSAGEHFIDIKFRKDGSVDRDNDSLQFKIQASDVTQGEGVPEETINKILNADSNLKAENIKKDVNIYGIIGTFEGDSESNDPIEDSFINKTITTYEDFTIKNIGSYAFYSCSKLTSVNFPACTSIGSSAFYSCSSLTSVNFPACTSIGSYAFYRCSKLTSITLGASSYCTLANSNAFSNTGIWSTKGSIFVPASMLTSYKTRAHWSYFSNRIFSIT